MSLIYDPIKYEIIRLYILLIKKMDEISRTIGGTDSLFNRFALEYPPAINLQYQADTFLEKISDLQSNFISEVYDTNNEPALEEINKNLKSTLRVLEVNIQDQSALIPPAPFFPKITQTTQNENGSEVTNETKSVKNEINYLLDTIHSEYYLFSAKTKSTFDNYLRNKYFSKIIRIFADEEYGGSGYGYNNKWEKTYEIDPKDKSGTVCIDFVKNVLRLLLNPGTSTPTLSTSEDDNAVEIPESFGLKSIGTYEPNELLNLDQEYIYAIAIFKKNFHCGKASISTHYKITLGDDFDPHQHIRQKIFYHNDKQPTVIEFGTTHAALLNFEDGKLILTHQTTEIGFQHIEFKLTEYYLHPENYLIEVFPVK